MPTSRSSPGGRWAYTASPVVRLWQLAMDSMIDGDHQLAMEVFADDAVWYDMFVGTVHGSQEIADRLTAMKGQDFDFTEVQPVRVLSDDETCAVEWIQVLRTGPKQLSVEGGTFLSVQDGRITRLWDYIQPLKNRMP